MNCEYHRWYSPSLNRDMELLVFGHAGARVLAFPTSNGKFYEWEDRGMPDVIRESLEKGWLQLYCVDSADSESWYAFWTTPAGRAYRYAQYDSYLYNEVLPFTELKNGNPYLITVGASFGGYHAMNFGLKHADKVSRILAMSGLFEIGVLQAATATITCTSTTRCSLSPMSQKGGAWTGCARWILSWRRAKRTRLMQSARDLSGLLWSKGIGNALREWDGWAHDWPFWAKMFGMYMGDHD